MPTLVIQLDRHIPGPAINTTMEVRAGAQATAIVRFLTLSTGMNMNMTNSNPLASMQNLKATLPSVGAIESDMTAINRQGYSSPLMVLPSGQTVPFTNYYAQSQATAGEATSQMPYLPTGMFPGFIGSNNMATGGVAGYGWPYGMTPNVAGFDPSRRSTWASEENANQVASVQLQQDYYNVPSSYIATGGPMSQHYIAGPIQPMKCQDNKSYEMVNLDELVNREPPIPRAVPALWTNQEELSLAKCLQNPEGITNVYIRGFMPETTDEDLHHWASRFGEIESCKAIIEQDTGKCKGYVEHPLHLCQLSNIFQLWFRHVLLSCCSRELHSWFLPPWVSSQLCPEISQLSTQRS